MENQNITLNVSLARGKKGCQIEVESKLRDAVRFLGDGIKVKPKARHPPRKSSMEQRLMEAKKAFKKR